VKPTLAIIIRKLRALNIVPSKVKLQRRLIVVKSVEEGDRISPLEGYWQLLKQKGGLLLLLFTDISNVVKWKKQYQQLRV